MVKFLKIYDTINKLKSLYCNVMIKGIYNMIKIAICDDDLKQIEIIQNALNNYFAEKEEQPSIAVFDNSLLFLEGINQSGGYDILLLDICMPGISGMSVAQDIRRRREKTEIVFLTTSDEFAVEAFSLKAAHYLLKPFTQVEFDEAIRRTMACFAREVVKKLVRKAEGGGMHTVDIGDIFYVESHGHTLHVHSKEGSYTEGRRSLARILEELEKLLPNQFLSPYKGYIINLRAVKTVETGRITLQEGTRIPIPKRGFRELQNRYFDYMFQEENKNRKVLL